MAASLAALFSTIVLLAALYFLYFQSGNENDSQEKKGTPRHKVVSKRIGTAREVQNKDAVVVLEKGPSRYKSEITELDALIGVV